MEITLSSGCAIQVREPEDIDRLLDAIVDMMIQEEPLYDLGGAIRLVLAECDRLCTIYFISYSALFVPLIKKVSTLIDENMDFFRELEGYPGSNGKQLEDLLPKTRL